MTPTFYDLLEHGRASGAPIVNGMPWSFDYRGVPVTHENDHCYLFLKPSGTIRVEDCGHICHHVVPYGLVPEAGCPVHDKPAGHP